MRSICKHAVDREIRLVEARFGYENVRWPKSRGWIEIRNYRLPDFYSQKTSGLLIVVPPHYGIVPTPFKEFYLNQDLRVMTKRGWQRIPHYHQGMLNKYSRERWAWYCIHPTGWQKTDNILTFIKLIDLLLQNPFRGRT